MLHASRKCFEHVHITLQKISIRHETMDKTFKRSQERSKTDGPVVDVLEPAVPARTIDPRHSPETG